MGAGMQSSAAGARIRRMDTGPRLVPLARIADARRAELLAARLESEGIPARVRSEAGGPYPFTVGQMAEAEVWVPAGRLSEAREVALAAEVDDTLGNAVAWQPGGSGWSWPERLLAAAVAALIIGLFVSRFVLLAGGG